MNKHLLLLAALLGVPAGSLDIAAAQGTLDVSLSSLAGLDVQLREQRDSLEAQRSKRADVDAQLSGLPDARRALEGTLTRDVRALYRLQRGGLLPIASGVEALLSHASRVAHFERLTRRTLGKLVETRRSAAQLSQAASEIDLQMAATEEQVAALEQAKASVERAAALSPPAVETAAPSVQVPSALTELGAGFSFSDSRPGAALAARSAQGGEAGERFSSQRGLLGLPVAGAASIEATVRPDGGGTALKLAGKLGASVRAAAAGQVVLAERNEQYGLFVIVDHGEHFRTVYAQLGSVEVQQGDAISKNARLGAAGSQAIYFEVRHGRRSQDARSWLGL